MTWPQVQFLSAVFMVWLIIFSIIFIHIKYPPIQATIVSCIELTSKDPVFVCSRDNGSSWSTVAFVSYQEFMKGQYNLETNINYWTKSWRYF